MEASETCQNIWYQMQIYIYTYIYHLESRWRNSHVLVLLSHLLGVAPSTFTILYIYLNILYIEIDMMTRTVRVSHYLTMDKKGKEIECTAYYTFAEGTMKLDTS